MWHDTYIAANIEDVLSVLHQHGENARLIAGATDLILEMERGVRKGIKVLVDVSRMPGQDQITLDEDGIIHLGPLVTHNHCAASKLIQEAAFPLARAAWEVGSPQIRNRGTIAGNLITASPANDTITPLMALGTSVTLRSVSGIRVVPLDQFYLGVRKVDLHPDEMLVDISFPAMKANQRGTFIKFALRRAQAISLVNAAVVITLTGDKVESASITLGAVAPTIIHAVEAETFLAGKQLTAEVIAQAAAKTGQASRPISDVRGSAGYRRRMVEVITRRALLALANGQEKTGYPVKPVTLRSNGNHKVNFEGPSVLHTSQDDIVTTINSKPYRFATGQNKSLLRLLREEAGLIGTKEGCAEGECGACTVFLDGVAVMSCMVPAARAHGAVIVTVEGLSSDGSLHPVQQAFIDQGAVQCGYCTPGFVMSAAKLLEERPHPTQNEIEQALTGNLCRCTGYYSIIQAVEKA
ncbi:MAG TPA: FAD binding domain-containing protein, partial [Bellilinea sp.]|nr:FAD binding domain-containing protein [Bellilinea sp.]